jgi:hypothetical protein
VADETLEVLKRIETKLSALLGIVVDQHLRATDIAKPRPRTVDRMLTDVGLTGVEIGRLLGKTPQAVSQVLTKDGKSGKQAKRSAKSARDDQSVSPTTEEVSLARARDGSD